MTDKRLSDLAPDKLHARLVELGEEWADCQAGADLLEETRKAVLAQLTIAADGKSIAEREAKALASPEFALHVQAMVNARKNANKARVNYDGARVWIDMVRSIEATKRQEMNIR